MTEQSTRPSWIVSYLGDLDLDPNVPKPQDSRQEKEILSTTAAESPCVPNAGTLKYFKINSIDSERIKVECNGLYDKIVTTLNHFFQKQGIGGSELERELAQISLSSIGLPEELRLLVDKTIYGISCLGPLAKPTQAQKPRPVNKVYV